MIADLHTHSTASDGQYAPGALAGLVRERGVQVWALTDHDTVDGVPEARAAAAELGLRFLPGIELSAKEFHTFHILGYGFDTDDPGIGALCGRMKKGRDNRGKRIVEYLGEKGMELTLEEVEALARGDILARPHFAQAMVNRGYVPDNRAAFDLWLDTDEFHLRVERSKPSARECVETIKAAGGVVSLAHPYQIGVDNDALEALVKELRGFGLDAIECFYPRFTHEQTAFYLHLTRKYGLHSTGGSDFHGEKVKPDIRIAALELELDWLLSAAGRT